MGEIIRGRNESRMRLAKRQTWVVVANRSDDLPEMLQDEDPERSQRVMKAMLQVKKLDIAGLERAYQQR
jgi:hypothetical protein